MSRQVENGDSWAGVFCGVRTPGSPHDGQEGDAWVMAWVMARVATLNTLDTRVITLDDPGAVK